jgi:integrase
MASVINDPGGRKRIQFSDPDGQRKTVRLGKVSPSNAQTAKENIEALVSAKLTGGTVKPHVAKWVDDLEDVLYDRIAATRLLESRGANLLGRWIDSILEEKSDLKPATLESYRLCRRYLVNHFGETRPIRSITREDAAKFRANLKELDLAVATAQLHVRITKIFFNLAVDRGLLREDPFRNLSGGSVVADNERYITPDEAARIIAVIDDTNSKVTFALARYAGLRVPSETAKLTWDDVDFERGRLTVHSPKTERYAGKDKRMVPVTPLLATILESALAEAPVGQLTVIAPTSYRWLVRDRIAAAVKRAGIERWPDLFKLLRASCEREWAMEWPQFAVSNWIGHSMTVSGKHYANHVPDELFDQAAQKAAQNAAQHKRADAGTNEQKPAKTPMIPASMPMSAHPCPDSGNAGGATTST